MMFWRKRKSPKVSIVVPVYNVERFLPECLDSLIDQKLKDIEIICVDDGSTDGSAAVLRDYSSRDDRITVISKENRGYGHTMNMGFAAATGEYVGIVESDDYADVCMFKDLYKFAQKHDCDIVKSNYYEHSSSGDVLVKPFEEFGYGWVFDPWEYQGPLTALPIVWSAIYKRSTLLENGVCFNETPGASYQDTSFVHQAWMSARRVAILEKGYIHYRVDNSASSVKSSSKVYAVCDEYAKSEEFMCRVPEREKAFSHIMSLMKLGTYRWNFNRISDEYRYDFAKKMQEEYLLARERGWLSKDYFCDGDWAQINLLLEDLSGFMSKYGKVGM